jgi:hypothetical protein
VSRTPCAAQVRTAQGLVHMGKGLLGLSPYHTERQLLSGERGRTLAQARVYARVVG